MEYIYLIKKEEEDRLFLREYLFIALHSFKTLVVIGLYSFFYFNLTNNNNNNNIITPYYKNMEDL